MIDLTYDQLLRRKNCPDCDGMCDRRAERCVRCAGVARRLTLSPSQRAARLRAQKRQWAREHLCKWPVTVRVAP